MARDACSKGAMTFRESEDEQRLIVSDIIKLSSMGPTPSAFPILIEMLLDFIAAALGIFSTEPDRIAGGETQGILAWLVGCRQSVENKGRDGGTDAVDLKS